MSRDLEFDVTEIKLTLYNFNSPKKSYGQTQITFTLTGWFPVSIHTDRVLVQNLSLSLSHCVSNCFVTSG